MHLNPKIAAAILCAATLGAHAADFTDGSFESLALADGQQRYIDNSSPRFSLDGWTASGMVRVRDSLAADPVQASDGDNLVFMNNGATLAQTFDTVVGQVYHVSFDFAKNKGVASVLVDGELAEKVGGGNAFTMQAAPGFDFTATGGETMLTFVAQSAQPTGGLGRLWLDNVAVTSAVPESSGVALMAAGLLMLGGLARRRRS